MLPTPRLIAMVLAAVPMLLGGALYEPLVAIGVIYLMEFFIFLIQARGRLSAERV